jgi:hypothetical protein
VRSTRDSSGFDSSLALLSEEDRRARNVIELGELFAKAIAYENGAAARENAQLMHRCRGSQLGARIDRDLAEIAKSFAPTKPAPRASAADVTAPTESELVAKAHSHLMFDDRLNAAERGALMLGISAAHDRHFAKAERIPAGAQIESVRSALERARAERDLGPAEVFVTEALATIERGIVDSDDRARLMSLLMQLRQALAAGDVSAL